MTAFNSIKTNNWPAASNDLEDFLVLELPLNDQAALTSSRRDIVAGSTVLHPKRTLTNTGVSMISAGGIIYSSSVSSTNGLKADYPAANLFDGQTSTYAQNNLSADNSITVDFSSNPISYTSSVRIYTYAANGYGITNTYYLNGSSTGTNFVGGGSNFNGAAWTTVATGTGTITQIKLRMRRSGSASSATFYAIEVDGTILQDGSPKKHYDNNATFNGSSTLLLSNSGINLGGDYCVECYFMPTGSIGEHTRVFEFKPANLAFYIYGSNNNTYVQVGSGSSLTGGANTWTIDTWHHFATTRQNGVTRLFIDGVQKGSSGSSTAGLDLDTTINLNGNASGSYRWNGAMQDFRIYNGVAKYSANFTPPGAILG